MKAIVTSGQNHMIRVVPEARDYSQHITRASNKVFNKVGAKIFVTGLSLGMKGTVPIFKSVEFLATSAAHFFLLLFHEWRRAQLLQAL